MLKKVSTPILSIISICMLANAPHVQAASWTNDQVEYLEAIAKDASRDALPVLDLRELDTARLGNDAQAVNDAATKVAINLARMHLLGSASPAQRTKWHIHDSDEEIDIASWLDRALATNALPAFFVGVRPQHPDYAALRRAYAIEENPKRRRTIARNMERWRWLPHSLGNDYVLVNIPAFEAQFWRKGARVGTWKVIVGKRSTPTPIFAATITGVTLNPWWNIPANIVREMRGRFPASKGYVYLNGGWKQKPGPGNALGQMKLVMPNPYSVFMHDTPGKSLFEREERAFSHGCIRTGDALGFAATLLSGTRTSSEIDAIVASGKTTTIDLAASLPLYVTYFTATANADGSIAIHSDIYNRDHPIVVGCASATAADGTTPDEVGRVGI